MMNVYLTLVKIVELVKMAIFLLPALAHRDTPVCSVNQVRKHKIGHI